MVKTHEINIKGTANWNQLTTNKYAILQAEGISVNDYILFKNVEVDETETIKETGLFQMTQVTEIIESDGLKDGYIMIIFNRI